MTNVETQKVDELIGDMGRLDRRELARGPSRERPRATSGNIAPQQTPRAPVARRCVFPHESAGLLHLAATFDRRWHRVCSYSGMLTILLIILALALVFSLPSWPYSRGWGYGPSGGLGLLVVVLLLFLVFGNRL